MPQSEDERKAKQAESRRKYYESHKSDPEYKAKHAEYQRNYYQGNREHLLAETRRRYDLEREQRLERNRNWRELHREQIQVQQRKSYMDLRHMVVERLGGKCVQCGFADLRALCIDHINGGGTKERKNFNMYRYYGKILQDVEQGTGEYQILCANCNLIKEFELRAEKWRK